MTSKIQLHYCDKKLSNHSSCCQLATHTCELQFQAKINKVFRCKKHITSKTVHGIIKEESIKPFDQQKKIEKVNKHLKKLVGLSFQSKVHGCTLTGKYIKPNGGLMCLSPNGKWKYVYYHQIDLEHTKNK